MKPENRDETITDDAASSEGDEVQNSYNEFEDAQDTPAPPLRRFTRTRKPAGEWWKTTSLFSQALAIQEVPTSYKNATTSENVAFWQPGIDREHDCLNKNGTWKLVDYSHGMKALPCKYVLKVKK